MKANEKQKRAEFVEIHALIFLPYRKVRRQMDMESEGELVRFFMQRASSWWKMGLKKLKTERTV